MILTEFRINLTEKEINHIKKFPSLQNLYRFKVSEDGKQALFEGPGCEYDAKVLRRLLDRIR
jgi:hypothetical protein